MTLNRPRPPYRVLLAAAGILLACVACDAPPSPPPAPSAPPERLPDLIAVDYAPYEVGALQGGIHVEGGAAGAEPTEIRVIGPAGTLLAAGPMTLLPPGQGGVCGRPVAGTSTGNVSLTRAELADFTNGWPSGYRLEIKSGNIWHSGAPTYAGCRLPAIQV